jgi:class 3 adenylate cyclase/tetratricopeptide (TPR) repeat protein
MECPRCQARNRHGVQFCEECGGALTLVCPSCSTEITLGKRFCGICGTAAAATLAEGVGSPSLGEPVKHSTTAHRTADTGLETERKQVTVLFADMKDSLALIANRDPEEVRKLLDHTVGHMMEAVHRYEGTVTQIMGDGIIALFGAPVAHEDHAARACYAALAMHAVIDRPDADLPGEARIQIRVGLNSGEVVVRSIRNDLRMDYAAIGQTVALAARMEQLARPATTLIAPATFSLIEGLFDVTPLGLVPIKGLTDPLPVYELTAACPARSRLQAASTARGLSRLVGRGPELNRLNDIMANAINRHGQLVALVGEPGVGKSRLVHEFAHAAQTSGWTRLEGRVAPYATHTAYFAIVDLLKSYLSIDEADSSQKVRDKLVSTVLGLNHSLHDAIPALCWLLDIATDDAQWEQLDAATRRDRTFTSVKSLFLSESLVRPLLLVVEDLHWADSETRGLLDGLVEILPTARIMLVVTYRPEFTHSWGGRTYYTQFSMQPLSPNTADELLVNLIGDDQSVRVLRQILIRQTAGNPFFLEEIVRALIESGSLVGDHAGYRTSITPERISIPASVHAVLAARIDRLSAEGKRLLQACSVIGIDVPFGLLGEVAGMRAERLVTALRRLQAAEFLYETALYPEPRYSFKHALTHEVAYSGLLREHRASLHATVVMAIEKLNPDRLSEHVESLARHAVLGELWDKAVAYLCQAGTQAAKRSAHRTALVFFDEALEVLRRLPPTRTNCEQQIELHFAARNSLWPLSDHAAIYTHLNEAERLAVELDDRQRLGWVASFKVQHYRVIGDAESAIRSAERALVAARDVQDIELEVDTSFRVGLMCLNLGQYPRAAEFLKSNITAHDSGRALGRPGQTGFRPATSRAWLAICLAEQGQFIEAVACATEAIAIAQKVESTYSLATGLFGLGGVQLYQGDLLAARETLEAGLLLCQQHDIPVLRRLMASELGYTHALAGRAAEAIPLLEEAAEVDRLAPAMTRHALYLVWLGEAYFLEGRYAEASESCRRAIELSRQRKERGHEAWALRLQAGIGARGPTGYQVAAEADFRAAVSLAASLNMRPLMALTHLDRGDVCLELGMLDEARRELRSALRQFGEMNVTLWHRRTMRALHAITAAY